ncbi:RelA/SpoT domain-containing protein [Candidatus Poribacteria bacterium]|nr:RelA/SpoT domain-containing protein [Candidatus Poribacteria bacterium]MBT5711882.1 RelA/SpoT domain-containing protein [Candidatus Poribacteria bacterium]MBT7101206.1 RelA/SpoT domain-containing protein [Candidatus Poribacteria bacterium]MBT7805877.1 RelA/SpoT domain-containing protein [Candidatus Poribacteria bacterium]
MTDVGEPVETSDAQVDDAMEAYRVDRDRYADFARAVEATLEAMLQTHDFVGYHASSRAKSPESLRRKLDEGATYPTKDCAGCRVLFYVESHIDDFVSHVYQEFEVQDHVTHESDEDYNAIHLTVSLGDTRRDLLEYRRFDGLQCEIQLSTVLYHAWSEMTHDTVYKPPEGVDTFDRDAFEDIRQQFAAVMRKHIRPATRDLDFIHYSFQRLREGQTAFGPQFLDDVSQAPSNNELYRQLESLAQYVGRFGDRTPTDVDIMTLVRDALARSRELGRVPLQLSIGAFHGFGFGDVAQTCVRLVDALRYHYPDEAFALLTDLAREDDPTVQERAVGGIRRLSEYNLDVLERVRYAVQIRLCEVMEGWTEAEVVSGFDSLVVATTAMLSPSFEGAAMIDADHFSIRSGSLLGTDQLSGVRARSVRALCRAYEVVGDLPARLKVLQALSEGTRASHWAGSDELDQVLAETAREITAFYAALTQRSDTDGHVLLAVEEKLHWLRVRYGDQDLPALDQIDRGLAENEEYQIFRTLVGYWGRLNPGVDHVQEREERDASADDYVELVGEETSEQWRGRIVSMMASYEVEPGAYLQQMGKFLHSLGRDRPDFALALLQEHELELEPMHYAIITGLQESFARDGLCDLLTGWVDDGKHLATCAAVCASAGQLDTDLADRVLARARTEGDGEALTALAHSLASCLGDDADARPRLVGVVRELSGLEHTAWVATLAHVEGVASALAADAPETVLEALLPLGVIGLEAEAFLKPIAEVHPERVVELFRDRVAKEADVTEAERGQRRRYGAVPWSFYELGVTLAEHAAVVVSAVLEWADAEGEESRWRYWLGAADLLHAAWPVYGEPIEQHLIASIRPNDAGSLMTLFAALDKYDGAESLWTTCKAVIVTYAGGPDYDRIRSRLQSVLSNTGVVAGEYGMAEAHERKAAEIEEWPDDDNPAVKAFLDDYRGYLQRIALGDRRRATREVEHRRREFGSQEDE